MQVDPAILKLMENIPGIGKQAEDPILCMRWIHPLTNWEWFITEYNPDNDLCYGYIRALENEWDVFTLPELIDNRAFVDINFKPIKFSDFCKGKEVV